MIIIAGVAGPSGRQAERVCKGSAPLWALPLVQVTGGSAVKRPESSACSACGPRQPLDGAALAGARQL